MTFLIFCLIIALGMTFVFYTKCCKFCGIDVKKLCSKCRSKRKDGGELKLRTSLRVQLAEYYRNGPGNGKTEIKLQRRSWRMLIKEELGESVYKDMQAPSQSINTILPYDFNTQGNLMGASQITEEHRFEDDSNVNNQSLENTMEMPTQQNDERLDFRAPVKTKFRDIRKQKTKMNIKLPPIKKFNHYTQFYRG